MKLLSDDAVVAINALTRVVEGQRQLIGVLTEEFGGLVGLMEEILPKLGVGDASDAVAQARAWLVSVKKLEVDTDEVLSAVEELKEASDMIAERFPDRESE